MATGLGRGATSHRYKRSSLPIAFRQDQLVIQMICLMDKLLREENLDLKLTPYKVLATSLTDGFVQFVDSHPIRDVIAEWNSIHVRRPIKISLSGTYEVFIMK